MAVSESNIAEFKMAAIIKLSQNEWVKLSFVQNGWIQNDRIKIEELKMVAFIKLSQIELVWVRVN